MTKHTIEDLERMYNMPDNKAEGESVLPTKSFKFKVGDKVHNTAYGYNAIIMRRSYIEDEDSSYNCYDLAIWGSMPPICSENVTEIYLKKGHPIE